MAVLVHLKSLPIILSIEEIVQLEDIKYYSLDKFQPQPMMTVWLQTNVSILGSQEQIIKHHIIVVKGLFGLC